MQSGGHFGDPGTLPRPSRVLSCITLPAEQPLPNQPAETRAQRPPHCTRLPRDAAAARLAAPGPLCPDASQAREPFGLVLSAGAEHLPGWTSTKPSPWLALPACPARSGTAEHLFFPPRSNKVSSSAGFLAAAPRCSRCRTDAQCSAGARAGTIAQLPGQPSQLCHGANSGAAVTAAGSHPAPRREPLVTRPPTSIPAGLSPCTPGAFSRLCHPSSSCRSALFP